MLHVQLLYVLPHAPFSAHLALAPALPVLIPVLWHGNGTRAGGGIVVHEYDSIGGLGSVPGGRVGRE